MARPRLELQTILENVLGSRNVYFQPPESKRLNYPCIVYERCNVHKTVADNSVYRLMNQYQVTYMDEDPESEVPEKLLQMMHCSFDRHFAKEELNHDVFTIYF